MKNIKCLIIFIGLISILITGCSNVAENEEQIIEVQKRIGDEIRYEDYKEITANKQVQKVKIMLDGFDWQNAQVDMVRPADYRFSFHFTNPKIVQEKIDLYELWISPNKDKVELVIVPASKYIQLDKEKSAKLFQLITGQKLSDL